MIKDIHSVRKILMQGLTWVYLLYSYTGIARVST